MSAITGKVAGFAKDRPFLTSAADLSFSKYFLDFFATSSDG